MSQPTSYALTFVSKDRPGIVAEATGILYEKGFNLADSSSTLLKGVFSMIFVVVHENNYTPEEIKSFFAKVNLKPSVYLIEDENGKQVQKNNEYVISVYGADKPGIVHSVTESLFTHNINIIDLQTQLAGTAQKEVYIMIMEVLVPASLGDDWIEPFKKTAAEIGTDVTVRRLEVYEL